MILNLSVEVSDEVFAFIKGYSVYKHNEKKSLEAKALFEELFSTLQAELEKEYQSTAQDLQALDKRLRVLEMYSADFREVDREINKLNNRMARIDSTLNEHERQQKMFAKQMEQVETTVSQFYDVINEDINTLRKEFSTKLKTEVSTEVERLVKRILANNFHETIKTSIDTVIKDYDFPKPDYDAAIKEEVANAVRNIPAPDYNAAIRAEVANAIKNIPAPDYNATIKAEIANIIKNIFAQNFNAAITNAVRNIFTQNFNAAIQAKVADTVKPELQNLTARLSAVEEKSVEPKAEMKPLTVSSYSYLAKIDKQREIIDAQQKSIQKLEDLVKDLTVRLSAVEEKSVKLKAETKTEIILSVRDENSWQEYKKRLQDIGKLEQFAQNNSDNFHSFASKLSKIKKAIDKINPQEFNEDTTETIVDKTVDIAKEFMSFLETCNRIINNPRKNSADAQELYNLIEEYLSGLGIRSMDFKAGGNYEEWADLGMSGKPIIEPTTDKSKRNKLKEIYIQPHFIYYLDEHDKKERRVFGGSCATYAYKD